MYGETEIEVYKVKEGIWRYRIVSGKNNTPMCISNKSYKSGDGAYKAAERLIKILPRIIEDAPRFFNVPIA